MSALANSPQSHGRLERAVEGRRGRGGQWDRAKRRSWLDRDLIKSTHQTPRAAMCASTQAALDNERDIGSVLEWAPSHSPACSCFCCAILSKNGWRAPQLRRDRFVESFPSLSGRSRCAIHHSIACSLLCAHSPQHRQHGQRKRSSRSNADTRHSARSSGNRHSSASKPTRAPACAIHLQRAAAVRARVARSTAGVRGAA